MTTPYEHDVLYKARWRQQLKMQRSVSANRARKGLVAVYVQDQSRVPYPFVELDRLIVNVLFDDGRDSWAAPTQLQPPLRFCGFTANLKAGAVQWGGRENSL